MEFIAPHFPESESEHEEEEVLHNNNAALYNLPIESDVLKRVNMDYQNQHQAPEDMDIESDFSNKHNDDHSDNDSSFMVKRGENNTFSSKKNKKNKKEKKKDK